jgi:hypothetical protein
MLHNCNLVDFYCHFHVNHQKFNPEQELMQKNFQYD